ncbi:MAG TPA: glycosyltransferase family 1 protein [Candidatus Paceibacterota bacterium]|nr:glycosyltransferase family 1 protein [Candidatus Paceibacterota bacterium]
MKRITIVTDAWAPQINGVVITLNNTISRLEAQGYEVAVIHPYRFKRQMPLPTYPEIKLAFCSKRKMAALIEKEMPDTIHIATEGPLGFAARGACMRKGWAFTTAYHTHFPAYVSLRIPGMQRVVYAFLRRFHNAAAAVMVPTESIRQELSSHGFKRLVMWPRGVDTNLFKPSRCTTEGLDRPCFAYFGRIAIEKNLEEFLALDLPGSKLVIGDGPDRAKLEAKYGERARFVGYKTGQDLVDMISCADVVVCPSYTETFGLTIVEALACGVPVAAHDAPGPRDILSPGTDGALDADLDKAARACLSLSKDACRQKALKYSWENATDMFVHELIPIV